MNVKQHTEKVKLSITTFTSHCHIKCYLPPKYPGHTRTSKTNRKIKNHAKSEFVFYCFKICFTFAGERGTKTLFIKLYCFASMASALTFLVMLWKAKFWFVKISKTNNKRLLNLHNKYSDESVHILLQKNVQYILNVNKVFSAATYMSFVSFHSRYSRFGEDS